MLPLAAFLLLLAGVTTPDAVQEPPPSRAKALFDRMHAGTYRDDFPNFPKVEWADIPGQLDRADGTRLLESFPWNPISSRYERACPEGVVALWLAESLRKGGKYPSLNALLTATRGPAFERDNTAAARAYRAWWGLGEVPAAGAGRPGGPS